MKSMAAIVTRTICDFHLTTFPPQHAFSPPPPPFPICALQALTSVTSHFPLPSEPVCFCFPARALCTGNRIHWEHSGRHRAAFPSAPALAEGGKKSLKEVSNSKTAKLGQKQKSAVLLPSDHFPPLLSSLRIFFFFSKTRAAQVHY